MFLQLAKKEIVAQACSILSLHRHPLEDVIESWKVEGWLVGAFVDIHHAFHVGDVKLLFSKIKWQVFWLRAIFGQSRRFS
jgi:hypothetical protein